VPIAHLHSDRRTQGTLGGLVEVTDRFAVMLHGALRRLEVCSSDPLCADHDPVAHKDDRATHGAVSRLRGSITSSRLPVLPVRTATHPWLQAAARSPRTAIDPGKRRFPAVALTRSMRRTNHANAAAVATD
jgi:hypothetical protein